MYVCICNAVTDSEIRRAAGEGVTDLWGLQGALGVAAGCGSCKRHAMDVLREEMGNIGEAIAEPRIYHPSVA